MNCERIVLYNDKQIKYTLEIKKVKNINLRIKENGKIFVSANENVPANFVDNFVLRQADFILKALHKFNQIEKCKHTNKQYISGETFYILGKNIRLKIIESNEEKIFNDTIFLYLYTKNPLDFNKKKKMIDSYIKNIAYSTFLDITKELHLKFIKYKINIPLIEVRNMKKRWGSCLPYKNKININILLIQAPKNCIEYVILHELCHFVHPNHSKDFYNFLTVMMPDWRERKALLEHQFINNMVY